MTPLRVLALEPYYGGSHRAFLDGWIERSRHQWTVLGLDPWKWKWRMRHAAVTLNEQIAELQAQGHEWDLIFCSDMLNLAEFRGLAPKAITELPTIVYFHENQLTYPVRHEDERDYHYVFTNLTSMLAADRVWFNSGYHRDSFLDALPKFLKRMPDHPPLEAVDRARAKTEIQYPGVDLLDPQIGSNSPRRIVWAARWEHDKNPDAMIEALEELDRRGLEFRVNLIGEQFREIPPALERAKSSLAHHLDRYGYQPDRAAYVEALQESDIAVSTAVHEFFGIGMVEAVSAACFPLVPDRLAYPEVLATDRHPEFLFADESLADRLEVLLTAEALPGSEPERRFLIAPYSWDVRAGELDAALAETCSP